jgi:hypothetical protein
LKDRFDELGSNFNPAAWPFEWMAVDDQEHLDIMTAERDSRNVCL